jgi:hypothetical protein
MQKGGNTMLDNSEVRAHLLKGEQAVTVLTSLGYRYETPSNAPHLWVAPENPQDALKDALEALIKTGIEQGVKNQMEAMKEAQSSDTKGPNWHLVEGMVGKTFRVRPENIPLTHPLRQYGEVHFRGVNYKADEIAYVRTSVYTGYSIRFQFRKRPYALTESVWLPLSCAAFQP